MVADKKESDGVLVPLKQNPDGQVCAELPKVATKLFEAKAGRDLVHVYGQHERVNLSLYEDFLLWVKAF